MIKSIIIPLLTAMALPTTGRAATADFNYKSGSATEEGFYVPSSPTPLQWMSDVDSKKLTSPNIVTMLTESGPTDVSVSLPAESFSVAGKEGMVNVSLVNNGDSPLTEIGYSWEYGTVTGSGTERLSTPVNPGERGEATLGVGSISAVGTYTMSITIDTFNDLPNSDPRRTATGDMVVMPFMPVTRPMVEEYVSLGCGNSPLGYVVMEEMRDEHGDMLVGLVYHTSMFEDGCMVVMPDSDFPVTPPGTPHGILDRSYAYAPPIDMPERWYDAAARVSPLDIDVTLSWTDDSHTAMKAEAALRVARPMTATDYDFGIILTADGLKNDEWHQVNFFNLRPDDYSGKYWDIFTQGGHFIDNLTFNNVVVSKNDPRGENGIIPADLDYDTECVLTRTYTLAELTNILDEQFINPEATFKAVAFVAEHSTGEIVNSNKSAGITFRENGVASVSVSLPAESFSVVGKEGMVNVSLVNYGDTPLTEVGYSWEYGTVTGSGTERLSTPVNPGERGEATLGVGSISAVGTYPMNITIDTFNDLPNSDPQRTATGDMVVMPFMPVTRPMVEEYTGLGCGYCPRSYVAMEEMRDDYGDLFVGLSYHTATFETGCMAVMPDSDLPFSFTAIPYGTLDRSYAADTSTFPERWDDAAARVSPLDIDITLSWTDDSHTAMKAEAALRVARPMTDIDYNFGIILTADGLKNDEWHQINSYCNGLADGCTGKYWDIFTQGGYLVDNLTFNNVVVSKNDPRGENGIIPADLDYDTECVLTRTYTLAELTNILDEQFINPEATFKAVAFVAEHSTGEIVNSNKSAGLSLQENGVASVAPDALPVATDYYDLQGRPLSNPSAGTPVIRIDRYSDGTIHPTKQIF